MVEGICRAKGRAKGIEEPAHSRQTLQFDGHEDKWGLYCEDFIKPV